MRREGGGGGGRGGEGEGGRREKKGEALLYASLCPTPLEAVDITIREM